MKVMKLIRDKLTIAIIMVKLKLTALKIASYKVLEATSDEYLKRMFRKSTLSPELHIKRTMGNVIINSMKQTEAVLL